MRAMTSKIEDIGKENIKVQEMVRYQENLIKDERQRLVNILNECNDRFDNFLDKCWTQLGLDSTGRKDPESFLLAQAVLWLLCFAFIFQ